MITARCIVEMLGSPAEYLDKTIRAYVDRLKSEKNLRVVVKIADVIPKESLFSTFADLEISFDDVARLLNFCIESMPSSVEILDPVTVSLDRDVLSNFINDLQAKLHTVDMDLKLLTAKAAILDKNSMMIFRNFVVHALKSKPMTLGEISNIVGVNDDDLEPYIDRMLEQKLIFKEKGVYKSGEKRGIVEDS
ncbi:hypothetical protein HY483_01385 [Candidatus Woesearchaeota archaeon]|nr:hypothetical protein [Candidatus Woesearchaeota archaeon]